MVHLADLTITELSQLIARQSVSPVEVLESVLNRISQVEKAVHGFIALDPDGAVKAARDAEQEIQSGGYLGPLHGIPIALKDNVDVKGFRTTAGSRILADYRPARDAHVTALLRSAGAIILGKNNMHEFALGATTVNPHTGNSRNAWDPTRIPGGSSGGSAAAVAIRECLSAIATDTSGSVRIPAALNGVTGIRPTIGRVSNTGVIPVAWSSDTVGVICRTAVDCGFVLEAISGYDPRDSNSVNLDVPGFANVARQTPEAKRVGLISGFWQSCIEDAVAEALEGALKQLEELGLERVEVGIDGLAYNDAAQAVIETAEAAAYHQVWLEKYPGEYGGDVRSLLESGLELTATQYLQAQRYRRFLRDQFLDGFANVDVFVTPTAGIVAPKVAQGSAPLRDCDADVITALVRFANLASLTGFPAVSVPCGASRTGLPVGMQIMGRPFDEGRVLQLAAAYQSATKWHELLPPLLHESPETLPS